MEKNNESFRGRIVRAVSLALEPIESVHAGWEGGSAAFDAVDAYSDIDLNFIVDDQCSLEPLYSAAEDALEEVSPITVAHPVPPGRYYKLAGGGDFLFVDLCFYREGSSDHPLEVERHGIVKSLFDKRGFLPVKTLDQATLDAKRHARYRELRNWFIVSQSFVRKAILRGHEVEALASFWSYTLRPLAELLRMRFCPVRWDFGGMRYLDRDLPSEVYDQFREIVYVADIADLEAKLTAAEVWGARLLRELDSDAPNS
jgi:hypothetical protein